jgi:hypothetical protein
VLVEKIELHIGRVEDETGGLLQIGMYQWPIELDDSANPAPAAGLR